jgi:uncharacterized Zn finger protein
MNMAVALSAWWRRQLQPEQLRERAGTSSFLRGERYRDAGHVTQLEFDGERIMAQVVGHQIYTICLWRRGAALQFSCTCPFAVEGAFCKHCVAVGLTVITNGNCSV